MPCEQSNTVHFRCIAATPRTVLKTDNHSENQGRSKGGLCAVKLGSSGMASKHAVAKNAKGLAERKLTHSHIYTLHFQFRLRVTYLGAARK